MTKEQVEKLWDEAGGHMSSRWRPYLERFATLVRNAALEEAKQAVAALECPEDEDNFEAGCMYGMHAIESLKEPTP